MKLFVQLLVGSSFVCVVAVASWSIGALMGFGLARVTGRGARPRSDIDDLLKRERAAAGRVVQAVPGGPHSAAS